MVMPILIACLIATVPLHEVRTHADAILNHQLDDGAIVHMQQGDSITIVSYFGNYAALGLFEAYRLTKNVVREGSFASVPELIHDIELYLVQRNEHPKPYRWKAEGQAILEKIQRAKTALARAETQRC
jgi:hypothetical protein